MTTATLSPTEITRLNLQLDTSPGLPKLPHIPSKINDCWDALTLEQQEANLLHVARWIVERDLKNFDMGSWHQAWGHLFTRVGLGKEITGKEAFNECGTVHCIAGTAQVMAGEVGFSEFPERAGRLLLGDGAASHFFDTNEDGLNFLKEVIARNS
jgi:hypothetical protein